MVSPTCSPLKTLLKLCRVASVCLLECNKRQNLAAGICFAFVFLPSLFASGFHSLRGWGTFNCGLVFVEEANIRNLKELPQAETANSAVKFS